MRIFYKYCIFLKEELSELILTRQDLIVHTGIETITMNKCFNSVILNNYS